MDKTRHPDEVVRIYEQILKESPAQGTFIEIGGGHKIHVIEAGDGPPLVMLHGTGAAAFTMTPILEQLQGVRAIVPDRPGNGLSDPVDMDGDDFRDWAVEMTGEMLDALGLDRVSLLGSSGGGDWAIWYALAHPERVQRLILLGSAPLLPGTQAPLPLRIANAPIIADVMARMPANESAVVQLMGVMGEGETIQEHPKVLQGLVAANNDPVSSQTDRREFSALFNLLGFREDMRIRRDDLAQLGMPTLVIWGEDDPLGGADVARGVREAIPNCELELLPAGHVPWLGHPQKTAEIIMDFMGSS